jgi:hypothetical protein
MSCAEKVEKILNQLHILKLLHKVTVRSGFLQCKKRCSYLRKIAHGILCAFLNIIKMPALSGYLKEKKVCLLVSLRGVLGYVPIQTNTHDLMEDKFIQTCIPVT